MKIYIKRNRSPAPPSIEALAAFIQRVPAAPEGSMEFQPERAPALEHCREMAMKMDSQEDLADMVRFRKCQRIKSKSKSGGSMAKAPFLPAGERGRHPEGGAVHAGV
ncbi:unnamed protein product [Prorocentrum cordatum]|uniref:Uncharacterized protein n=1 Tax=Prorocentrum cordatum TaxID=2364126 RepID=A0ABN9REX9_9DINO|nr:unnamed protein product [Polarella glacialis]